MTTGRLEAVARPTRYEVEIEASPEREEFEGSVQIELEVEREIEKIELHSRSLEILSSTWEGPSGKGEAIPRLDPKEERVVFSLPGRVPVGRGLLSITFRGRVSKGMEGLYLSRDGPDVCLATQCEETEARAIFPCFDEPSYKARFRFRVRTDPRYVVLSNAPLERRVRGEDGMEVWVFEETPPIPTYLVALVLGELGSTPEVVVEGIPVRVWALGGKERFGIFARDFALRLLPYYREYFDYPYPFRKYDQVAVPSFSAGAMENPGLVLFRQALLLVDPETSSHAQRRRVALVVAHECAHMWFGDLVTMEWWDDIWLNESFAEWMAHKAVDTLEPTFRVWDDFLALRSSALFADSLESTHPIVLPVRTPQEATEAFDPPITYSKGSAVLRMLESFLGEEEFRKGLRSYMREFEWKNARKEDLWRHLSLSSERPVGEIMASWILSEGHPVVSGRLLEDGRTLEVSQERFFSSRKKRGKGVWKVPLVVRYGDSEGVREVRYLLEGERGTIDLSPRGSLRWVLLNSKGAGFYRSRYEGDLFDRVLVHSREFDASEQSSLIEDVWGLVRNGSLPPGAILRTLESVLQNPHSKAVLSRGLERIRAMDDLLEARGDTRGRELLGAWARRVLQPEVQRLGWVPRKEGFDDSERRAALFEFFGVVLDDGIVGEKAWEIFERERGDPSGVDPTLAPSALLVVASGSSGPTFDLFLSEYLRRRDSRAPPSLVQRYLMAFPYFEDPPLVERTLGLLSSGVLPLEAVGPILRIMLGRRATSPKAWEFLKGNWRMVRENLGDMWTGNLVEASGGIPTRLLPDFLDFFSKNLQGVAQRAFHRAREVLEERADLEEWLSVALSRELSKGHPSR